MNQDETAKMPRSAARDLDSDDLYRSGLLRRKHLLDLAVPHHQM